MNTATIRKTLRRGVQQLRADVMAERDLSEAMADARQHMDPQDQGFLVSLVGRLTEPQNVVHQLGAHLLQGTNWIVIVTLDNGEEIRQSFPCDPQKALQVMTDQVLNGKQARLIAE